MKEIIPADVLAGGGHRRPGETARSVDRSRASRLLNRRTRTLKEEHGMTEHSSCIISLSVHQIPSPQSIRRRTN